MKKYLVLFLALLLTGCFTSTAVKPTVDLEKRVSDLEEQVLMLQAMGVGAATHKYGRDCTDTGTCAKSVDSIACATPVDGDYVEVKDSNGDISWWVWDDDGDDTTPGAENLPWIIEPNDVDSNCAGDGRWVMISGVKLKNDGSSPGSVLIYEDWDTGQNYIELTTVSDIDTNKTFINLGREISAQTLTDAGLTLETDDAHTAYYLTIAGLTGDREADLPASTGSGIDFCFFIQDGDDTYAFRIDPNGTDRIIGTGIAGTNNDGDYIGADGAEEWICIYDCASGRWCTDSLGGTWTWE